MIGCKEGLKCSSRVKIWRGEGWNGKKNLFCIKKYFGAICNNYLSKSLKFLKFFTFTTATSISSICNCNALDFIFLFQNMDTFM